MTLSRKIIDRIETYTFVYINNTMELDANEQASEKKRAAHQRQMAKGEQDCKKRHCSTHSLNSIVKKGFRLQK